MVERYLRQLACMYMNATFYKFLQSTRILNIFFDGLTYVMLQRNDYILLQVTEAVGFRAALRGVQSVHAVFATVLDLDVVAVSARLSVRADDACLYRHLGVIDGRHSSCERGSVTTLQTLNQRREQ